jgi:hypothetical protein
MPIKLLKKDEKHLEEATPLKMIRRMAAEYKRVLYPFANENLRRRRPEVPQIKDTLSAWVSRKELEALLDDNKANGMRIYFGIHPDTRGDLNPDQDLYGRHNVILVATIDSVSPENPTTENSVNQLKESTDPSEANSIITSGEYEGMGADYLSLCPPRCPKDEEDGL